MFTLTNIARAFANLDEISEVDFPSFDKSIRNLSQRTYLTTSGKYNRADLYSFNAAASLRISQKAAALISDRWILDSLARWLQNEATGSAQRIRDGDTYRNASPIEEAVAQVEEGRTFNFHIAARKDGIHFYTDRRKTASKISSDVWDQIGATEDVWLTIPASRLIRELRDQMAA